MKFDNFFNSYMSTQVQYSFGVKLIVTEVIYIYDGNGNIKFVFKFHITFGVLICKYFIKIIINA